jgi:hypothetical protein
MSSFVWNGPLIASPLANWISRQLSWRPARRRLQFDAAHVRSVSVA